MNSGSIILAHFHYYYYYYYYYYFFFSVTATYLTINDLKTVYNKVQDARSQWYMFGLELGIIADDLDSIKSLCRGETIESLLEVLKLFLRRAKPKPTWQLLADALNSVGCEALAEQLRET